MAAANNELKKLKRMELLELLLAQSREIDRLKAELETKEKLLEERRLAIDNAGSMAEASLSIFHVLEDAQKAADLYLENARQKADEYTDKAGQEADKIVNTAKEEAKAIVNKAREDAQMIRRGTGETGEGIR